MAGSWHGSFIQLRVVLGAKKGTQAFSSIFDTIEQGYSYHIGFRHEHTIQNGMQVTAKAWQLKKSVTSFQSIGKQCSPNGSDMHNF